MPLRKALWPGSSPQPQPIGPCAEKLLVADFLTSIGRGEASRDVGQESFAELTQKKNYENYLANKNERTADS